MRYLQHASITRRTAVQAGAVGLLGLGMNHLDPLRAMGKEQAAPERLGPNGKARSVIYLFLSGGLAHIDSFDMKPDGPDTVRGEFKPIACATPGMHICEHLPKLAARSDKWWWDNLSGPDSSSFVAVDQIRKTNVQQLAVAWTYPYATSGFNPIVVNDVLYTTGRNGSLIALDASIGKELWIHERTTYYALTDLKREAEFKIDEDSPPEVIELYFFKMQEILGASGEKWNRFHNGSQPKVDAPSGS